MKYGKSVMLRIYVSVWAAAATAMATIVIPAYIQKGDAENAVGATVVTCILYASLLVFVFIPMKDD